MIEALESRFRAEECSFRTIFGTFQGHRIYAGRKEAERKVVSDLLELIKEHDPDLILLPYADIWVPLIVRKARRYGLDLVISRTGFFKQMASKSYWINSFHSSI
jgi:DNA polymerase elongation subunit (family B)